MRAEYDLYQRGDVTSPQEQPTGTVIKLPHCEALLHPATYCVTTRFPDGKEAVGQRLPTPENAKAARELGYEGSDERVCWMAGAEHEVAHAVLWDWMYGGASPVLRFVAAGEPCPLHLRWWKESMVLAFQKFINTGVADQPFKGVLPDPPYRKNPPARVWRVAFEPYRKIIEQAWEERA